MHLENLECITTLFLACEINTENKLFEDINNLSMSGITICGILHLVNPSNYGVELRKFCKYLLLFSISLVIFAYRKQKLMSTYCYN